MKTKKLLLAVIAISILSLSVIFSGCAVTKQQKEKSFLNSKHPVGTWKTMNIKDHKKFRKYEKICNNVNLNTLPANNLFKNCSEVRLQHGGNITLRITEQALNTPLPSYLQKTPANGF
jgi:hypothetical protein